MCKTKNEKFINMCVEAHGNKYDYSFVNYINNETKVKIICRIHGVFEQEPKKHINRKQKCPKCTGHKTNTETFIEKAKQLHGGVYDYSSVVYNSSNAKVKIICPIHGVFEQSPNAHLSGKKCYKCSGTPKKINSEFIDDANKRHKNKYDYSLVKYEKNNRKVDIICHKHGLFKQTPAAHLKGQGCPICRESKGELYVREFLMKNRISFVSQKRFENCRHILPLPFDFYLLDYNICIEYHGHQHYNSSHSFGSKENEFKNIQERDKIKETYCLKNNIPLLIIPYKDDIDITLLNFFNTYVFKTTT